MAIDESIMASHQAGKVPPTLRFFRWRPACVSLGYFQSAVDEIDLEACGRLGIDVVRRPTGGRAVVHNAELTYSVVARVDNPAVSGNVLQSYQKISQALLLGLGEMGVSAEMKPLSAPPDSVTQGSVARRRGLTPACFDLPSDYEIAVAGRKLIGSAQTRRGDIVLQHGSLLFEFDPLQMLAVLRLPEGRDRHQLARWLSQRVTSLSQLCGGPVSFETAVEALGRGFAEAFQIKLEQSELTIAETALVQRLKVEKYGAEVWNLRR